MMKVAECRNTVGHTRADASRNHFVWRKQDCNKAQLEVYCLPEDLVSGATYAYVFQYGIQRLGWFTDRQTVLYTV